MEQAGSRLRDRDLIGVARYLKSGDFVRSETEPPLPVNVDGELVASTPREFSVARNALHVLVPQESTAARYDA